VAEDAGAHILGWCACRMIPPEAELLKIAVRQKYRHCGIGNSLLEHLLAILHTEGITCLLLEVRSNNRGALEFYEKQGFLHAGKRPNYYTDPPDNAMIMRKNLSK